MLVFIKIAYIKFEENIANLLKIAVILSIFILCNANLSAQVPDTLWTRTYGGSDYDYAEHIEQTTDGGYIMAGYSSSFGTGGWNVYLIKTDINGDTLWTRFYSADGPDMAYCVKQTDDGGYIVACEGFTNLIKLSESGDSLWTRDYGIIARYVEQTNDGGDINGDENIMGNDVTYGVRYFKGIGNPPPDSCVLPDSDWLYSSGDANGNCSFTGSDITFIVAYFKGYNPEILWCPQTPPPY